MWLRDPEKLLIANPVSRVLLRECVRATYTEKGRVESSPRAGSLIYSTRPHDAARGCCYHTKGLKSSQTAVDLGDLTGGTMLMVRSSPESNWQPLAPRRRGVAT